MSPLVSVCLSDLSLPTTKPPELSRKVLDFNVKRAHFKLRMKRLRRTRHRGGMSGVGAGIESGGANLDRSFADEDREEREESDDEHDDDEEEEEEEDEDEDDLTISLDVDRSRLLESTFEALHDVNVRTLIRGRLDVVFEVRKR